MAKNDTSVGSGKVRGPASAAEILGRPIGAKLRTQKVPEEVINQRRSNLLARVVAFASVDGASTGELDPEMARSRI